MVSVRRSVTDRREPIRVDQIAIRRRTFRTQGALVDRGIGVTFDVDDSPVLYVDELAAADRAVWTNRGHDRIGVANMLDWRYGYRVAVHIARALEYAHEHSIIHRNVTPQNILWRAADKTVLLGDLMLAKALEGTLAQQITRPGELLGARR